MVITRWAWYYVSLALFVLGFITLIIIKTLLNYDLGIWYWVIFGLLILNLWRSGPPYRNYTFKTENVKNGETLYLAGGLGRSYEVILTGVDRMKGLLITFYRIDWLGGNIPDRVRIGETYILPSSLNALLSRVSGHLDIAYVHDDTIKKTRYLEKVPYGATGIMLYFAVQGDECTNAMLETVRKPYSMWAGLKGLKNELV